MQAGVRAADWRRSRNPTLISDIIALIDRVYSPLGIGIDRGGNGAAVEQELQRLDKYRSNYFAGRLVGYDFGGSIALGDDEQGRPIKKRVKEQMTAVINRALSRGPRKPDPAAIWLDSRPSSTRSSRRPRYVASQC